MLDIIILILLLVQIAISLRILVLQRRAIRPQQHVRFQQREFVETVSADVGEHAVVSKAGMHARRSKSLKKD